MTPLQKAAQAAIDILESGDPLSCEREAADDLQKALDAEIAQSVEPVAWVRFARKKPTVTSLSFFSDLTPLQKAHGFVSTPLCHCHPPQPQATAPMDDFDMRGVLASNLLCWKRLTESEAQDLVCFFEKVRTSQGEKP